VNNSNDLVKKNEDLQQMVSILQQELVKKTLKLKEVTIELEKKNSELKMYGNNDVNIVDIPIGNNVVDPPKKLSKSDPEVIVDVNLP
jgi:hypothetical protein